MSVIHKTIHKSNSQGFDFILSDATPDRYGDIVEPAGWQLSNFRRNPIALFSHSNSFPVGKWNNVNVKDGALIGTLELAPRGSSERIDEIRALVEADILRAVSVGFAPLESEPLRNSRGGTRYTKQELVECSIVSVPANPNALNIAKELGISRKTLALAFNNCADDTVPDVKWTKQRVQAFLARSRERYPDIRKDQDDYRDDWIESCVADILDSGKVATESEAEVRCEIAFDEMMEEQKLALEEEKVMAGFRAFDEERRRTQSELKWPEPPPTYTRQGWKGD